MSDSLVVRWPIKDSSRVKEGMTSENEMKTTTAEVLNPDLCKFCRVFFDTWSSFYEYSSKHDWEKNYDFSVREPGKCLTLDQLKPDGIALCNDHVYDCKLHHEMEYEWRISISFRTIKDGQWEIDAETKMVLGHASNFCYIDEDFGQNSCKELRLGTTEQSTRIVRAWIRECYLKHSACKKQDTFVLPTRLVKVDSQGIRLCISANENCSEYATLSHCWGKAEVLRLQKHNFQDFLIEIPYNKLCKTFRDAIDIARILGFSWLWIDSLCIVQGDPEDWSKEASRMATVYGLSSLNIAATAAPDGTIGCLFERDLRYTETHKIEVEMNHQKQVYNIADRHLYGNNIAHAALTTRAWAVQERILAPRTLHFAALQLSWECRTNQACETFPGTLPERFCDDLLYLPKQELQSWYEIIKIYTHCSLTNESDCLVAIGGVARQHQKKNGDKYFAGLWQSRIREQMCWHTHSKHERHPRENTLQAPSWSWAAVNHEIIFPGDTKVIHEAYIDVTKVEITLEDVDDPFGGVKSGVLTLRSKSMIICETGSPLNKYSRTSIKKFSFGPFDLSWDHENCGLESYPKSILILPIGVFEDDLGSIRIEGLLLIYTNQENGQYERVGHFCALKYTGNYEPIRRAMNLSQDEQFKELGLGDALPSEKDYISVDVDKDRITWYTISIV